MVSKFGMKTSSAFNSHLSFIFKGTHFKCFVTKYLMINKSISNPNKENFSQKTNSSNPNQIVSACASAFRVSGPPGPGRGQTYTKIYLGQVGMCLQNFIKIGSGLWISISPLHTNRQRNVHLYAHLYLYITYIYIYIRR